MIRVTIDRNDPRFRPGETINGVVQWQELYGETLEVRLAWYIERIVDSLESQPNSEVVAIHKISQFDHTGSDPFQFIAPHRPHSFSGKLFSIRWAIETLAFPQQVGVRMDLVISNSGKVLGPISLPTKEKK